MCIRDRVDAVPIFAVLGTTDFAHGQIENDAHTIGPIDKILSIRGHQTIDARNKLLRQDGRLALFGLEFARVPMEIQFAPGHVQLSAAATANIPFTSVSLHISGSLPYLRDAKGSAIVKADVGGFSLGDASLDVAWSRAQLQCKVLGCKLTIVTPAVNSLTPNVILEAIAKLFDFHFDLSALLKREIVINLVDSQGKKSEDSMGQGEPPPNGTPSEDNTNPNANNTPGGKTVGHNDGSYPDEGRLGAEQKRTDKNDSPVTQIIRGGPTNGAPSQVYTYREGKDIIHFVPDTGPGPAKMEIVSSSGNTYFEHFEVSPVVRQHLHETIILDRFEVPSLDYEGNEKLEECVLGNQHDYIDVFITIRPQNGQIAIARMGRDGTVLEPNMSTSPVSQITQGSKLQLWDWMTSDPKNPKRLEIGDIALLREWARAQMFQKFGGFGDVARQDTKQWQENEGVRFDQTEGYFFSRIDELYRKAACFQFRDSEMRIEANDQDWLYSALADRGQDAYLRRVVVNYAAAMAAGREVTPLYSSNKGLDRLILLLGPLSDRPAELLFLSRSPFSSTRHVRLNNLNDFPEALTGSSGLNIEQTKFLQKLSDVLETTTMEEVWITSVAGAPRAIFASGLASDDWKVLAVLYESKKGDFDPTLPSSGIIPGATVAKNYSSLDVAFGASPHELQSEANRRWFIPVSYTHLTLPTICSV